MQERTSVLEIHVSTGWTEVTIRQDKEINTANDGPINIGLNELDEVEAFTYLGSIVNIHGGTNADIKARIVKAKVNKYVIDVLQYMYVVTYLEALCRT